MAGCRAAEPPRSPAAVLKRYIDAVETDRPRAAYALLDPRVREQVDEKTFIRRWREYRPELEAQADALREQTKRSVEVQARIVHGSSLRTTLVKSPKGWHVQESSALQTRTTDTPSGTLQAFVAALERRSYPDVMGLLAPEVRETIEEDIEERIRALKEALSAKPGVQVSGDRATLRAGRFTFELLREGGQWRIVDAN